MANPSVRLSVRPLLQKSAVTLEPLDGSVRNFQGPLTSSQVIFKRGQRGQARTSKKRFSAKSISSGGFGAGGSCCTFSELGQQGKQNLGSRISIFVPRPEKTGPEGRAGQGPNKDFGILTFFIKGTPPPLKLVAGHFLFYATF